MSSSINEGIAKLYALKLKYDPPKPELHQDSVMWCPCADCLAHGEAADLLYEYPDNSLTRAQAIAAIAKGELNDEKTAVEQFDIFVELGIFTFTDVDFSTKQIKLSS